MITSNTDNLTIAMTIADALYNFPSLADATDYFQSELMISYDDTITTRDELIDALDRDICDLIHNANLSDIIPTADELDDDAYDALARRITSSDDIIALTADRILNRINPDSDNFNE